MDKTQSTDLLFELSRPGRRCHRLPACDVPIGEASGLLPADAFAAAPPPLPEIGEIDLVRHSRQPGSTNNMAIDTNFYPLGSCTMKYNPKRNERLAARCRAWPTCTRYQPEIDAPGDAALLYELQHILAEIAGLPAVSLQPAAGAHGEMTALLVAAAYFRDRGENRSRTC